MKAMENVEVDEYRQTSRGYRRLRAVNRHQTIRGRHQGLRNWKNWPMEWRK